MSRFGSDLFPYKSRTEHTYLETAIEVDMLIIHHLYNVSSFIEFVSPLNSDVLT